MLSSKHKSTIRHWYKQLQAQNPGFVTRPAQASLIAQISRAIAGDIDRKQRILLAEAGTGTGKSLAYLLAAIPLAKAFNKTLVVSTATVSLQQQLIEKDLPLLHLAAEGKFSFALAKGRHRYCCTHKLANLEFNGKGLSDRQKSLSKKLLAAIQQNKWKGDRDSWPTKIPDSLWKQIEADGLSCSPQFPRHRNCPFHKARHGLKKQDVIVANHSLLLADLLAGSGHILPPAHDCIYILDEAHQFPEIAREANASALAVKHADKQLKAIVQFDKLLVSKLDLHGLHGHRLTLKECCASLASCFASLSDFAFQNPTKFDDNHNWRFANAELPSFLTNLANNARPAATKLRSCLQSYAGAIQEAFNDNKLKAGVAENYLTQVNQLLYFVESWAECLYAYQEPSTNNAYWLQRSEHELQLCHSPIEIGGILQNILWQEAFAAVAVSATLSALGRFDFFLQQAGLVKKLSSEQIVKLPSPFDYKRVDLLVPKQQPDPNSSEYPAFVAERVMKAYQAGAAVLVLCNSYRLVDSVRQAIDSRIDNLWIQGELSNNQLLDKHRRCCDSNKPSVILATIGFSEGIDLPGDYLTHLIIARLPFAVPTDPVMQSHSELLESKNLSPFMQLTLPAASRKLLQSCGRLMRKEQDSGTIELLDQRILTRRYGKQLIAALPPYNHKE